MWNVKRFFFLFKDCEQGSKDFRSEQCKLFNSRPFRGRYHQWEPYIPGKLYDFLCKQFYIKILMNELGINSDRNKKASLTYEEQQYSPDAVTENHTSSLTKFNIKLTKKGVVGAVGKISAFRSPGPQFDPRRSQGLNWFVPLSFPPKPTQLSIPPG